MLRMLKFFVSLGVIIFLYKFFKRYLAVILDDDFYQVDSLELYKKIKDKIFKHDSSVKFF